MCTQTPGSLCNLSSTTLINLKKYSLLADAQPLFDHLSNLCSGAMPVIIIGDYNFSGINWETLSGDSPICTTFCGLVFDLNLNQLVGSPTHICGNILDLSELIQNIIVHPHEASPIPTDHLMIGFQLSLCTCSSNKTPIHYIYIITPKQTLRE